MPSALCCSVTRVAPLLEHFLGLDCLFHRTCASFPVNSASNPELFSPRRLSSCSLDGSCSAALFRASLLRFSFPALLVSAILARSLPQPFLAPSSTRAHRHGFLSFGLSVCYPSTLLALRSLLRLRLVFASVPVSWPAHLYSCFSSLMFVRTPNSDLLHGLSLELPWRVPDSCSPFPRLPPRTFLDFCWPFPISPYLNRLCLLAAHTFNFRVFIVNFVPRASLKLVLKGPLLQCFNKTQSNRKPFGVNIFDCVAAMVKS